MRETCRQVGVACYLVLLILTLVGCGDERAGTPVPTVAPTAAAAPPTSGPVAVGILPTATPRPHPPTPTLVPAAPYSPTPAEVVTPTRTQEAGQVEKGTPAAASVPTEAPAQEPARAEMVLIPAGEFIMGSTVENESPPHPVSVTAFEIDRFEVTNDAFQQFVADTGYQTEAEQAGEESNWRAYAEGNPRHPVVKVTWNDAGAYCQWAGKRLPTEAEWEKAARGTEQLVYPWGNEWDPDRANTKVSGYRGTTVVGSFPQGVSPYGLMDMAGNVAEWTSDWYEAYPGSSFSSPYFGEQYRVIRGGGWFSDEEQVRTTERSASSEDLRNDDVGFRCARPR
jgi:formylglycine-generating enzyme required for sulfatase activity